MNRAVFLDRDGTLNVRAAEHEYITAVSQFQWLPGVTQALGELARLGYTLVVVSNQRGVGRGVMSYDVLTQLERKMQDELARRGCRIAAFRYCIHLEEDRCACRKPAPGLILAAAHELALDLRGSWMVGDMCTDVQAGAAAGCLTAYIGNERCLPQPNLTASSLPEVVDGIVAHAAPPIDRSGVAGASA